MPAEQLSYYVVTDLIRNPDGNFSAATSTTAYVAATLAAVSLLMF
jgi:hypothetical protein